MVWQHSFVAQARSKATELELQAKASSNAAANARDKVDALKSVLGEEQTRAQNLQKWLAEWDGKPEATAEFPQSLEPGQRWVSNQPWCYLPKRYLLGYGFQAFSRCGRVTEEAALLFGLSPGQRARIVDAYAEYIECLHAIDQANLRAVPNSARFNMNLPEYKIRSYELTLPTESIAAGRDEFEASLRAALSDTQGKLFLKASDRQLSPFFYELSHSSLRLTYAEPITPMYERDEGVIMVEYDFPAGPERGGNCRYLYPIDEDTDVPFHHYATMIHGFENQSGGK